MSKDTNKKTKKTKKAKDTKVKNDPKKTEKPQDKSKSAPKVTKTSTNKPTKSAKVSKTSKPETKPKKAKRSTKPVEPIKPSKGKTETKRERVRKKSKEVKKKAKGDAKKQITKKSEKDKEKKVEEGVEEEEEDEEDVEIVDEDVEDEEEEEDEYIVKQKPELPVAMKKQHNERQTAKKKMPDFKRQAWFRYKRLGEAWRKPRGLHSKLRTSRKYRINKVRVGYKTPELVRGLHSSGFKEILVYNKSDLDKLDPKLEAARIGHSVGTKKRIEIEEYADELGIRVLNRG